MCLDIKEYIFFCFLFIWGVVVFCICVCSFFGMFFCEVRGDEVVYMFFCFV